LQIRSDVERQGDFIRFLIKEVESAAFADIDDVVTFVKWLDVELSRLVMTSSPMMIHSPSSQFCFWQSG
jgi:hypothetical protein